MGNCSNNVGAHGGSVTPVWLGKQESHPCPHHPVSCGPKKMWAQTAQAQLCRGPQGPRVLGTLILPGSKDRGDGWGRGRPWKSAEGLDRCPRTQPPAPRGRTHINLSTVKAVLIHDPGSKRTREWWEGRRGGVGRLRCLRREGAGCQPCPWDWHFNKRLLQCPVLV